MSGKSSPISEKGVFLHQEDRVPELPDIEAITSWIRTILRQESDSLHSLYYVFLDDAALLKINQEYLQHDTYTDIITFPYQREPVEAEIYISTERVRSNAFSFGVPVREELLRVMAHGILHVCGWDDHSEIASRLMRKREDACLLLMGIIPKDYAISPA